MEWSRFPLVAQRNILKHCDFPTRFTLRETCDSMKELVNQEPFEIDKLQIECKSVFLKVKLELEDENYEKTFIVTSGDVGYWKMPIIAEFSSFLGDLKNTLISNCFVEIIDDSESTEELVLAMDNFRVPPKIGSFLWKGSADKGVSAKFLEVCDKRYLMEFRINGSSWTNNAPFEIFEHHIDALKKVGVVEIEPPCDATGEHVLAMTSKKIRLESNNFTADMIKRVIEKCLAENRIGLSITLTNKINGPDILRQIQAPEGFSTIVESQFQKNYQLRMENATTFLNVTTSVVNLTIRSQADQQNVSIFLQNPERRFRFPRGFQPAV